MDTLDGGPAFPCTITNLGDVMVMGFGGEEVHPGSTSSYKGMGLRDYFAANADEDDVVEVLSEHYDAWCDSGTTRTPEYLQPSRAEARYMFADAMLAARGESK